MPMAQTQFFERPDEGDDLENPSQCVFRIGKENVRTRFGHFDTHLHEFQFSAHVFQEAHTAGLFSAGEDGPVLTGPVAAVLPLAMQRPLSWFRKATVLTPHSLAGYAMSIRIDNGGHYGGNDFHSNVVDGRWLSAGVYLSTGPRALERQIRLCLLCLGQRAAQAGTAHDALARVLHTELRERLIATILAAAHGCSTWSYAGPCTCPTCESRSSDAADAGDAEASCSAAASLAAGASAGQA